MRAISQASTPIPPTLMPRASRARRARVAGMRVARRGLELAVRLAALGEEVALLDLVVDEVPRQELVGVVRAMDEAIRIDDVVAPAGRRLQHRPPVVGRLVQTDEQR